MTFVDTKPAVRDLMTHDPVCVRADASLRAAAELLDDYGVGGLPVVDGQGFLVGLISRTDLVRSMVDSPWATSWHGRVVGDLMSAPAVTVQAGNSASLAAKLMSSLRIHRLIVVGDEGSPIGVVSASDLLRNLADVCDE